MATLTERVQGFWLNTKRIFAIAIRPTRKEYFNLMKVCTIGIAIVGVIAFGIQMIMSIVDPTRVQ